MLVELLTSSLAQGRMNCYAKMILNVSTELAQTIDDVFHFQDPNQGHGHLWCCYHPQKYIVQLLMKNGKDVAKLVLSVEKANFLILT